VSKLAESDLKLLVAQPIRPPAAADAADQPPPEFVSAVRADGSIAADRLSTVDNIDDLRGRAAAVLALAELQNGRTGHYGFGSDTRVLPDLSR
jgi:hypothetical protein